MKMKKRRRRRKYECYQFPRKLDARKYSSSRSSLTSIHEPVIEVEKCMDLIEIHESGKTIGLPTVDRSRDSVEKRRGFYRPEDFVLGDIVWAKSGKRYPAWPAIVIDPMLQAPDAVLSSCIPGAICVMFFGYSGNGNRRDYAWVKHGMIFPFIDYVDRFQGQTQLHKSKPSDFRMAIEEAFLAENGFADMYIGNTSIIVGQSDYNKCNPGGIVEATDSNQDQECHSQNQASVAKFLSPSLFPPRSENQATDFQLLLPCYAFLSSWGKALLNVFEKKKTQPCHGCGFRLPLKTAKNAKGSTLKGQILCKHCTKVKCDGCKVWVHAECDKISSNLFKDLEDIDYYCPDCKAKFNFELSDSEKLQPKSASKKSNDNFSLPDRVLVVCTGMEGIYFPSLHLSLVMFISKDEPVYISRRAMLGAFNDGFLSSLRLMLQVSEHYERGVVSENNIKRPSIKERKLKLLSFLQDVKLRFIKNAMGQEMLKISHLGFAELVKLLVS
ncbi:hypothetical protein Syun_019583 [Stephania yunnanensis]|uniref:PWWP domain-containing protein n=1 Tax=Stephania yunnanensis TaxID=152371 RepID=A0AAP0IWS2_9MAGN